jgi:hypothetical protein
MKSFSLLLICVLLTTSCFSQNRDFIITLHKNNNIKPKIDSIDFESFNKIRKTGISSGPIAQSIYFSYEQNKAADSIWKTIEQNKRQNALHLDSLVRLLKNNYASSFREKDSCLILNGFDKKIEICNNKNSIDNTTLTYYEFKDYQKDYLVIVKNGYEQWEYILFNPRTRNYKYLEHSPYFMNDSIVYCSDNYYGEGGFQIMHLTGKPYFGFESYDWELEECYRVGKVFYISFRSNFNRNIKPKYLKFNFNEKI